MQKKIESKTQELSQESNSPIVEIPDYMPPAIEQAQVDQDQFLSFTKLLERHENAAETIPSHELRRYHLECEKIYDIICVDLIRTSKSAETSAFHKQFHEILSLKDKEQALEKINVLFFNLVFIKNNKEIDELKRACKQIQIHLKLQQHMQIWKDKVTKSKHSLSQLKLEIEASYKELSTDLPEAHPRTINILHRSLMEARGWIEVRRLMAEYKNLQAHTDIRLWIHKQKKCLVKIRKVAAQCALNAYYLRELAELEDAQARRPLSQEWLLTHSLSVNPLYLDQDELVLTEKGEQRAKRLLEEAINPYATEVAMPKKISRNDLILLSLYLGQENMEKYARLYALYGDGTPEHPFNMDNLRAILIGMAANRRLHMESAPIKQLLDTVTNQCCNPLVLLGASPRMLQSFNNRSQNSLPEKKDDKLRLRSLWESFLRWAREFSYEAVDSASERYAAPSLLALNIPAYLIYSAVFTALTHTKMDNDPAREYMNDLNCILAQHNIKQKNQPTPKIKTGDGAVEKIFKDLQDSANFEDFCELYPMFNDHNAHLHESKTLRNYYFIKSPSALNEANTIIKEKVKKIDQLARGQQLAHELSYIYTAGKEEFIYNLQDRELNPMRFQCKNIISPEAGFGVNLFSPAVGQKIYNNRIPLMILLPGTHNQAGTLRDLETRAPGKAEWTDPEKKLLIIKSINDEIKRLKQIYGPDSKISLEQIGHSLGGSDALHMELVIMEAMIQNMPAEKIKNFRKKLETIFTKEDEAELQSLNTSSKPNTHTINRIKLLNYRKQAKEQLKLGLTTALGEKPRVYDTLTDPEDDRSIPKELRTYINQENIASISSFCNRGSGATMEDTIAASACMGLLAEGEQGTEINQDCLDVEGDPLRLIGTAKYYGAVFVDPNLNIFNSKKLNLNDISVETGIGFKKAGFITNAASANQIAPVQGHVGHTFGGNRYGTTVRIRSALDTNEYEEYKAKLSGRWFMADWLAVRGAKWLIYKLVLWTIRFPTEYLVRFPVLMLVPSILSLGSTNYDASYTGSAEEIRRQREKLNIFKKGFNKSVRKADKIEENIKKKVRTQGLLNVYNNSYYDEVMMSPPRIPDMIQKEFMDEPIILNYFTYYIDSLIHFLTPWKKATTEKNTVLFDHLKHQLVKAEQYRLTWHGRLTRINSELELLEKKLETHLNNEDRKFLTYERDRLKLDLKRLEVELKHHNEFIDLLQSCFAEETLNSDACIALINKRLNNDQHEENYIEERNPKTLSLETKTLMPLIMAMQKQNLIDAKKQRKQKGFLHQFVEGREEKELKDNIQNYRAFLIQEDYLSKNVMSSKWLQKHSTESTYLKKDAGNLFTLTNEGLDYLQVLFNRALSEPLNNEPLSQEDLVLLGYYFGRSCVKKVLDRYSLKGDGTDLHPFSLDNLRSLMIGAAAFQKTTILDGVTKEHLAHVKKTNKTTLEAVTNPEKQVGALIRIMNNFKYYEQNELAKNSDADIFRFGRAAGRGLSRMYEAAVFGFINFIGQVGAASITSAPISGDTTPAYMILASTGTGGLLGLLTPDNPSKDNFTHDLEQLYFEKKANQLQDTSVKVVTTDESVKKIIDSLPKKQPYSELDLKTFFANYPMFQGDKKVFLSQNQVEIENIIKKRVTQINDWGRAEQIATEHALYVSKTKATKQVCDRNGTVLECTATSVTNTGVPGFHFNCFWPLEKPANNEPIPLMITIPENIDTVNIISSLSSLTRWAAQYKAGHQTLEENAISQADRMSDDVRREYQKLPQQEFNKSFMQIFNEERRNLAKQKIIKAINKEIDKILAKYGPDAKINIELFGRGIAATQAYQLELYILEALAARLPNNPVAKDSVFQDQNLAPRIKRENIVGISSYAFSSVGEPAESARKRAELVDFLAGDNLKIVHNSFTVEGDFSPYMGADHADRYIDTNSNAFKDKGIEINHVNTLSGRGLRNTNWLVNGLFKGKLNTDDLTGTYGRFSGPARYQTNSKIASQGSKELVDILNEQTGHTKITSTYHRVDYANKSLLYMAGIISKDYWSSCKEVLCNPLSSIRLGLMWAVLYPTQKGAQSMKWATYSWPVVAISKYFREFVYDLFSTKGVDADIGSEVKKEKAREQEVESVLKLSSPKP